MVFIILSEIIPIVFTTYKLLRSEYLLVGLSQFKMFW